MKKNMHKPAMSWIVGYRYEGTILDLPRVEAILRRAEGARHADLFGIGAC